MSKQAVKNRCSVVFWWLIKMFPLICYALQFFLRVGTPESSLYTFLSTNLEFITGNVVYSTLAEIFGADGFFPMFAANSGILIYFSYFVFVEFVHILVDVLVFLPVVCRKLMTKWGGSRDED